MNARKTAPADANTQHDRPSGLTIILRVLLLFVGVGLLGGLAAVVMHLLSGGDAAVMEFGGYLVAGIVAFIFLFVAANRK